MTSLCAPRMPATRVSAPFFGTRRSDPSRCSAALSPHSHRAFLLHERATSAEQTWRTTAAVTRIAQACHRGVRDGRAGEVRVDRIGRVILRLRDGVQGRNARCLPSGDSSQQTRRRLKNRVSSNTYIFGSLSECAESNQSSPIPGQRVPVMATVALQTLLSTEEIRHA